VQQICTIGLYFDDYFLQIRFAQNRKKIVKKSNSKFGRHIFVFRQKLLIFTGCKDNLTPELPFFEFFKNLHPFLSYSKKNQKRFLCYV